MGSRLLAPRVLVSRGVGGAPTPGTSQRWNAPAGAAPWAQTLFPLLVNAPGKRFIMLAEGTHTIMMEKNRLELFRAVQGFLDEAGAS